MFHLDLCSGIGGFALAARWAGFQTVQFVEIDNWCQKLLKQHWPDVPVHDDLKTFNGEIYNGTIDILTAGYPCQPFSVAGKQLGEKDERHLWPDVLRIIKESKPRWIICENVEGHVKLGLDSVLNDLERENYTIWTFIIPACAIGAPHKRNRLWIIAHDRSKREQGVECETLQRQPSFSWCKDVRRVEELPDRSDLYPSKLCRSRNGISERLDSVGNAVVPEIPYLIMETIKQYELTGE